jgi:fatty acid desaturase
LPFRWLTIDLHYYRWMTRREGGLVFAAVLGLIASALCYLGHAQTVIFCWLLPARIAIGLVAFSFSYFPHAPHTLTTKENRYRASNILLYPGLTPLLLCQNYHLVHHLYPGVPFYRYARLFIAKREELIERGAAIYPSSKR